MTSFRTDKIEHGYLPRYVRLLGEIMHHPIAEKVGIVELGVRDGASMEMWATLAPDAIVIGVDNSDHAVTNVPGTHFIRANQEDSDLPYRINAALKNIWKGDPISENWEPSYMNGTVDLLVDDASHDGEKTRQAFDNLWQLVGSGGYYVIEDWYVGFDGWPDYDRSMLDFAEGILGYLQQKALESDMQIDSIEYRYGMILIRRAWE